MAIRDLKSGLVSRDDAKGIEIYSAHPMAIKLLWKGYVKYITLRAERMFRRHSMGDLHSNEDSMLYD